MLSMRELRRMGVLADLVVSVAHHFSKLPMVLSTYMESAGRTELATLGGILVLAKRFNIDELRALLSSSGTIVTRP